MSKPKRYVLSLDAEIDFDLIGICSHHSDYRLAWGINQELRSGLAKSDELFVVANKKGQVLSSHSYHFWEDEENLMEYYLMRNKSDGKFLLPEKHQIDYFLFLRNNSVVEPEEMVEKLKRINSVVAAYHFDPYDIPSAEQIIFE